MVKYNDKVEVILYGYTKKVINNMCLKIYKFLRTRSHIDLKKITIRYK